MGVDGGFDFIESFFLPDHDIIWRQVYLSPKSARPYKFSKNATVPNPPSAQILTTAFGGVNSSGYS